VEDVINKALEKDREARYQSAAEMLCDLQSLSTPGQSAVSEAVLSSARTAEASGTVLKKRRRPLIVSAVVVAAAIAASAYFFSHRTAKLTSKDSIILADFTNTTGDAVFDGTLRQGLVAQLEQSPYLDVRSDEQIAGTLRLMGQPAAARLTHELARQVCRRTGGAAMLDGSIAQIGSQYNLVLDAVNCSTGARLASAQAVASDKNHVLGALDSAASAMRANLGESLASIQRFNRPLEEVTTPSLEALQAYTLGWRTILNGDPSAAVGSFQWAISLDPNFAMAYAVLGTAYFELGETRLSAENTRKAYDLRDRVSEREKFYISSSYEENVTKHVQILKLWAQTYPRDAVPVAHLSWDYADLGQYDEALAAARRALELAPDVVMSYEVLAESYLYLDRFDEAAAVLQQAKASGMHSMALHECTYGLAFFRGDTAGMAREAAGWAADAPRDEEHITQVLSDTAAYAGHLAQANDLTARAVASARRAGAKDRVADYLGEAALREAWVGNLGEARKRASAALQESSDQNRALLALALVGDLAQPQKFAADLSKRSPQDTETLPRIRAAIALGQKSPAKAIADLRGAVDGGEFPLYQDYLRGEAYLAADQGSEAAAEFQKIIDHPGIMWNWPYGSLAHLGLARAFVLQGDTAKAKAAYQDFLTLWKDADSDLLALQQAKAESARLR
jgi:eukaryotic-like serine/threonine-protein kinase